MGNTNSVPDNPRPLGHERDSPAPELVNSESPHLTPGEPEDHHVGGRIHYPPSATSSPASPPALNSLPDPVDPFESQGSSSVPGPLSYPFSSLARSRRATSERTTQETWFSAKTALDTPTENGVDNGEGDDDDDLDLVTLLRKRKRTSRPQAARKVIRHDNWESQNLEPRQPPEFSGPTYFKVKEASPRPSDLSISKKVDGEQKDKQHRASIEGSNVRGPTTQKPASHGPAAQKPTAKKPPVPKLPALKPPTLKPPAPKPSSQGKHSRSAPKSKLAPFRVNHRQSEQRFIAVPNIEPNAEFERGEDGIARGNSNIARSSTHTSSAAPESQPRGSIVARVGSGSVWDDPAFIPAPSLWDPRELRSQQARQDTALRRSPPRQLLRPPSLPPLLSTGSDTLQSKRELPQQVRPTPLRLSPLRPSRVEPPRQKPLERRPLSPPAPPPPPSSPPPPSPVNNRVDENYFFKIGQRELERTEFEKRGEELIRKFQSPNQEQPPREQVLEDLKWGYTVKCVDGGEVILDDDDRDKKAITIRTFADRQKANEYLDNNTNAKGAGGLDRIVSRTSELVGPERLLKVNLLLDDGEHHLMWVEKGMVVLSELKQSQKRQAQWRPAPRPPFAHYIVSCDMLTYETAIVRRLEDYEDGGDEYPRDPGGELGTVGAETSLEIEKAPPITFTVRELANEYAGQLFLEKTSVRKQFSEPADVLWWKNNAVPEHKEAMARVEAGENEGLFEAVLKTYDMNRRLGFDQIIVLVTAVDDVAGPVNV